MKSTHKGFTLIEMLIVIVIIGILSAALIPRLTGIQARARDTARTADLRNTATALEVYKLDHGSYPIASYAFNKSSPSLVSLLVPSIYAANGGSSLEDVTLLTPYVTSLPKDPNGQGVKAKIGGDCLVQGTNYAYFTDPTGALYAITAVKESKRGNASTCGDTIDRPGNGEFEKVGKGLATLISAAAGPDTDVNCFEFSAGTITLYSDSCTKDVVIPSQINGQNVVNILDTAFQHKGLSSVFIPNSVITLGDLAFMYNGQNSNSEDISDFVPSTNQTRNIVGAVWVKQ